MGRAMTTFFAGVALTLLLVAPAGADEAKGTTTACLPLGPLELTFNPLDVGLYPPPGIGSISVGHVNDGYIVDAMELPAESDVYRLFKYAGKRKIFYGTEELVGLIDRVAKKVNDQFPDANLLVGNMSAKTGGDIGFSASHHSGRDVDLGFYLVDEEGKVFQQDRFSVMRKKGSGWLEGTLYFFDRARNWALVKALITDTETPVQYIFIEKHLKYRLLMWAEKQGEDPELIDKASKIMMQPSETKPHNDHFHVRIYCPWSDVQYGCRDFGAQWEWLETPKLKRKALIESAVVDLDSSDPAVVTKALDTLRLMNARGHAYLLVKFLKSPHQEVRDAAVKALAKFHKKGLLATFEQYLTKPTTYETEIAVLQTLPYLVSEKDSELPTILDKLTRKPSRYLKKTPLDTCQTWRITSLATLAMAQHSYWGSTPRFVELLDHPSAEVKAAAAYALQLKTNQPLPLPSIDGGDEADKAVADWKAWYGKKHKKHWAQWIRSGFKAAGITFTGKMVRWPQFLGLMNVATSKDGYLSYNAQRILKAISGKKPYLTIMAPKPLARRWYAVFKDNKFYILKKMKEAGIDAPVPEGL